MTQMVPVKEKAATIQSMLMGQQGNLEKVLPRHLTAERVLRIAYRTIVKTPKLLECTPGSLVGAVVEASQLGLECDGVLGHAYLVPYGKTATLIPGYKGLIRLAMQTGNIGKIDARLVREGDEFSYSFGLDEHLRHKPADRADARVTHAYAIAWYKDGVTPPKYDVMPIHDIENIRQKSKAANTGPWVTDHGEMCKKTVLRRLCKTLESETENHALARAIALDEHAERGLDQQLPIIDVDAKVADKTNGGNGQKPPPTPPKRQPEAAPGEEADPFVGEQEAPTNQPPASRARPLKPSGIDEETRRGDDYISPAQNRRAWGKAGSRMVELGYQKNEADGLIAILLEQFQIEDDPQADPPRPTTMMIRRGKEHYDVFIDAVDNWTPPKSEGEQAGDVPF